MFDAAPPPATQGEAVARGLAKLVADTASVKSLAVMAGASVAGAGLKVAANIPAITQILAKVGIAPKVTDVMARTAIPTAFTAMQEIEAGKEDVAA